MDRRLGALLARIRETVTRFYGAELLVKPARKDEVDRVCAWLAEKCGGAIAPLEPYLAFLEQMDGCNFDGFFLYAASKSEGAVLELIERNTFFPVEGCVVLACFDDEFFGYDIAAQTFCDIDRYMGPADVYDDFISMVSANFPDD